MTILSGMHKQTLLEPGKHSLFSKLLWKKYFLEYGFHTKIHFGQSRDSGNRLFKEILTLAGIKNFRNILYHPQENP